MKNSLYKIEKEYLTLMQEVELMEGEITEEMETQLAINESQLKGKSIAYLSIIKQKETFNGVIDEEIKRLQALKKRNNTILDRLNNSLLNAVKLFGNFESGLHKFSTRKSTTLKVEDVNALPKEYKVIKVTEQADKMKIKQVLKMGETVKGCELVENINLKIN